jgi:hypothetical protein
VPHTAFNGKTLRHTAFTYSHTLLTGQHNDLRSVLEPCGSHAGTGAGCRSEDWSRNESTVLSRTLDDDDEDEEEDVVVVFTRDDT